MSLFVLDASSVLTWCFPDENASKAPYPLSLLHQSDVEAIATSFWPVEVLNALLMGERRQRITQPLIRAFLDDLRRLPVRLDPASPDMAKVEILARQYKLTAYDAAYLELALRLNIPLATLDKAFCWPLRRQAWRSWLISETSEWVRRYGISFLATSHTSKRCAGSG